MSTKMTTEQIRTLVTLPTYNEAQNIASLIEALRAMGLEVLVADDFSPDGTWKIVQEMGKKDPGVHLLLRKEKRGRGYAGAEAFARAIELGAERIVEMDADFSHRPKDIPNLLEALKKGAQIVLGSRYTPGGKDARKSVLRHLLTRFSSAYARVILQVPYADPNTGFRAYRAEVFLTVRPEDLTSPGPGIVHEVLFKAHLAGLKIVEAPILFVDREAGQSELTFGRLLMGFKNVLDLRRKYGSGRLSGVP